MRTTAGFKLFSRSLILPGALVVVGFVSSWALTSNATISGQPDFRTTSNAAASAADREIQGPPGFEQLESEAIEFVKQHHPELVSLLQVLKEMREKEYEAAIREIVKARKRLESIEKRDPESYAIELDGWKVQSKIDLLLAKGVANAKSLDTTVLRKLLKEQVEIQKKRMKYEQASLAKRQAQLAESLEKLEGHENERVDQQFTALMKRVDAKTSAPNKNKPDNKPTKEAKVKR